jgi:hypothetical protein
MAKNGSHGTDEAERIDEQVEDPAGSLLDRGRAVAEQLPNAVDGAWGVIAAAHGQVDDLSDQGVITAVAFSAGDTMGLILAGAPRLILALALIPTAITARSAILRGVRPARLVN